MPEAIKLPHDFGEIPLRDQTFPPWEPGLREVTLPLGQVTLLEDRALVSRTGPVTLTPGRNRLLIRDVAPVLQEVSLRGEVTDPAGSEAGLAPPARVVDVRVRRAMRVRTADKPELARELEEKIEALERRFEEVNESR